MAHVDAVIAVSRIRVFSVSYAPHGRTFPIEKTEALRSIVERPKLVETPSPSPDGSLLALSDRFGFDGVNQEGRGVMRSSPSGMMHYGFTVASLEG